MAAYLEITNKFADESTRKLEFGPFDSDAAVVHSAAVKLNVAQVNSNAAALSNIYLSEGGASFVEITQAVITTEKTREINLN